MAKKNIVSNHPKQQTPPMSSSHTNIIGAATGVNPQPPDDDDDICPVCESECTCHNRTAAPSQSGNNKPNAGAPSAPSSSTFSGSFTNAPLKIKLTLPPSLKLRKHATADQPVITTSAGHIVPTRSSSSINPSGRPGASAITSHTLAPNIPIQTVPNRRGRPPKALVSAREAAKAASVGAQDAAAHAHDPHHHNNASAAKYPLGKKRPAVGTNKKKTKARITTGKQRKPIARKTIAPLLSESELSELSDTEVFPTFVPAASTSSHSSSSESSESDSDFGDIESEETSFLIRDEQAKAHARKKGDHSTGNNWEIRPRKRSVGAEEEDADTESGDSSDDEDDEMDEDNGEDDADEELEADVEGPAEKEPDEEDTGGRLGVSFGGGASSWSEDEESSFDADLFFANLDDTSDSGSDYHARGEDGSDVEASGSFSADEEDALLLMDIDSSVHLRRTNGELEFGLEFDTFSFGWDGHLLLTSARLEDRFDVGFSTDTIEGDVDMLHGDDRSVTHASSDSERMSLEESDGETTEDELVDSNGLPNSRAMMLFRWPSAISTVDPLSTVGQVSSPSPRAPSDDSESMRVALGTISAQRRSPVPTPADILAGRVSLDDLDDIESDHHAGASPTRHRKRFAGPPPMGDFLASDRPAQACAIIDGKGADIPSPFSRSKVPRKRRAPSSSSMPDPPPSNNTETLGSSAQSSDEVFKRSQLQMSPNFSSTEAVDLDDVLDSSFVDSDPLFFDYESQPHAMQPVSPMSGPHMRSLSRWDRIPMATFRRTRETAVSSVVNESAGSDTGLGAFNGMGAMIGSAMLTQPKPAEKKSPGSARKRSKGKNTSSVIISPVLPPLRDGDRTPTSSSPNHGNRPKKEVRREKAMMKRKMMGKPVQHRHQQVHHAHNHLPNFKTRASSSTQRGGSSSVPPFSL